jgi:hypothetical protein
VPSRGQQENTRSPQSQKRFHDIPHTNGSNWKDFAMREVSNMIYIYLAVMQRIDLKRPGRWESRWESRWEMRTAWTTHKVAMEVVRKRRSWDIFASRTYSTYWKSCVEKKKK